MVKLIRLSSDDNGTFKADLDSGIEIKENASIALQNLTFETNDFTAIDINGTNNIIKFDFGLIASNEKFLVSTLKAEKYNTANIRAFYEDLQGTLNKSLAVGLIADGLGESYANFMIAYDNENIFPPPTVFVPNNSIVYKLSPILLMWNFNRSLAIRGNNEFTDKTLFEVSKVSLVNRGNTLELAIDPAVNPVTGLGNMRQITGRAATNKLINYVFPQAFTEWSRGSAMFMCGVALLIDNTGDADTNGFSIGLSFEDISNKTDIGIEPMPNSVRTFECRLTRPQDTVQFITPDDPGVLQDSGYTPYLTTAADPTLNDHILYERKQGILTCSIVNSSITGGLKVPIFTYALSHLEQNKTIEPYIVVFGERLNAIVGRPVLTVNPIYYPVRTNIPAYNNEQYAYTGQFQRIGEGPTAKNAYDSLPAFSSVFPYVNDYIFEEDPTFPSYSLNYNPTLSIHASVLRTLGFSDETYPGNNYVIIKRPQTILFVGFNNEIPVPSLQFDLISDGLSNFINSDNYSVILDSNPLYSYDASKFDYSSSSNQRYKTNNRRGRRLNILATLPVNNNTGIVEFSSNELVYIDFDNKFPQIIKNLRLRVLDKDFKEIETKGESIMTLLIKDN